MVTGGTPRALSRNATRDDNDPHSRPCRFHLCLCKIISVTGLVVSSYSVKVGMYSGLVLGDR
jgi:hypothetical protein